MKPQTALGAFWEAWQSTIVGFVLAWLSTMFVLPVCLHLWGMVVGGTAFTAWMTALSLVRQWLMRMWTEKRSGRNTPPDFVYVVEEFAVERIRQIGGEGFSPAHDDDLNGNELQEKAACYALAAALGECDYTDLRRNGANARAAQEFLLRAWPEDFSTFKPTRPRRDLVKAGALIVAAIGRIDRAKRRGA